MHTSGPAAALARTASPYRQDRCRMGRRQDFAARSPGPPFLHIFNRTFLCGSATSCKFTCQTGGASPPIAAHNRSFYQHCTDSDIVQLRRLAWTVYAWQNPILAGLHTGISNGGTEGYNRIVKHIGRIAFGFSNQDKRKRRIRYACTRKSRASTSSTKPC